MNAGIAVFLAGLFLVPIILLWWGHRLRRLDPPRRRAFWGAIIGHCVAGTLAVTLGMIPPEAWTEGETVRGFFGLWSMLLFPLAGGITGALTAR
jgi:hypothetical protein